MSFAINAYLPGKLYGWSWKQLKDMFPVLIATIGMVLIIVVILATIDLAAIGLGIDFRVITTYLGICCMLKIEEVNEFFKLLFKT
jgi:ABC-type Fe3+-siderophore transport system permease subunit